MVVLRKLREENSITQTELAARLGVPQSFVSNFETGERRVDLTELHAIAEALGEKLTTIVDLYLEKLST